MTKAHKTPPTTAPAPEQAHNIWLAGLGAWAQAQAEGSKMFETLVRDGLNLQRQTQASLAQATEQFTAMTAKASKGLNGVFEQRVAQSMARMGIPGTEEWSHMLTRMAELEARVQQLLAQATQDAAAPDAETESARTATRRPRKAS